MDMILELWLCIPIFTVQNIKGGGVKAWAIEFEMIYTYFCILKSLKVVFSFFFKSTYGTSKSNCKALMETDPLQENLVTVTVTWLTEKKS